jgi:2-phospho-L-lactate transferase/gluconeogenesis factor (CofD/UPF0052 family)
MLSVASEHIPATEVAEEPRRDTDSQIKVALFCGGRGSASIIREFLRWQNVQLTLLINAYDDGLSTGGLRRFIPGMLGPSDFRKNLSYVLDLHSETQYALARLMESRLPASFGAREQQGLRRFAEAGELEGLPPALAELLDKVDPSSVLEVRRSLVSFLSYSDRTQDVFDYDDCAFGNLVFAGYYLLSGHDFNAASRKMSRLVNSRAELVNVATGDDRVLVALKADGSVCSCEAEIVAKQSAAPILDIFFVAEPILENEWKAVEDRSIDEKLAWLRARAMETSISPEAAQAIKDADVIVYGPGTQHSSLLPSYRITKDALKASRAKVKAFVVNLGPDNDIQGLRADELVDRALRYAEDEENRTPIITHILFNEAGVNDGGALRFGQDEISHDGAYRGAKVVRGRFSAESAPQRHNGFAIVQQLLRIAEDGVVDQRPSLQIFVDLYKRSAALDSMIEEFLEIDWSEKFRDVRLRIVSADEISREAPGNIHIQSVASSEQFPEVAEVIDWIVNDRSDFLVTLTGDGEYRFRDVRNGVALLREGGFGAIYGSRTQSRAQFSSSVRAAYSERRVLRRLSIFGAFLLTILYAVRFGVIFSDPLTGFRIYRRQYVKCLKDLSGRNLTPTSLTKQLISKHVEIAELPVSYRTFVGFTDPAWRLRRGFSNLFGMFR